MIDQDMSNNVLHIYAQTAPESLPSLILLSRLQGYSPGERERECVCVCVCGERESLCVCVYVCDVCSGLAA